MVGSLLLLLLLHGALTPAVSQGQQHHPQQYFCIENYKPIGNLIRAVNLNKAARDSPSSDAADTNTSDPAAHLTSGHTARRCSTACDRNPACTAFRAVGSDAVQGPLCQLLSGTTASLPTALALPPGADWPTVLTNLTPVDGIELRSLGWLCIKGAADWDAFGRASHALIMTGKADPNRPEFGYTPWCAIGVDVAGANQQQVTNISKPADCDEVCSRSPDACQMFTFVAAKPGSTSGQAPRNCFTKIDPFRGQNGWTGPPKADIWQPDSQMDCFARKNDWHQLGLILSPAIQTVSYGSSYFTVFPERVTWQQANASCSQLPGGRLAVLNSREALTTVYRSLLTTLPSQTAVRSAWVGAVGRNTNYRPGVNATAGSNPAAVPAGTNSSSRLFENQTVPFATQRQARGAQIGPQDTLTWVNGEKVESFELRQLEALPAIWSVHDVIWAQQVVPDNASSVCGRVMVQTASPQDPLLDPSAVLPGVWYFDCAKPAGFICESTAPPTEPMAGRTVISDGSPASIPWDTSNSLAPWKVALATLLPTLAVLLVAWQWIHFRANRASRLPDLLWQQKKRLAGVPRWGDVSVVVTDIQDFTRLTQEAPQAMAQALVLHNQVVRQAAYDHVGSVLLQEGDSFLLAFHEPQDAVEFALQIQLALHQQAWPAGLQYPDHLQQLPAATSSNAGSAPTSPSHQQAAAAGATSTQQQLASARHSLDQGLLRWLSSTVSAAVGGGSNRRLSDSMTNEAADSTTPQTSQVSGSRADALQGMPNSAAAAAAAGGARWGGRGLRQSLESSPNSPNSYITTARDASPYGHSWVASNPFSSSSIVATRQRNAWLQQLLAPGRYHGGHAAHGRSGDHYHQQQQHQQQQQQEGVRELFKGLRVRVGVASGYVPKGQELRRSQVYRMAQDVSNAATGGQVLLDEPTFAAVKESMRRLGLITSSGLDYETLYASGSSSRKGRGSSRAPGSGLSDGSGRSGWVSIASDKMSGLLPSRMRRANRMDAVLPTTAATPAEYAVTFDMGCYELLPPDHHLHQHHQQHQQLGPQSSASSAQNGQVPGSSSNPGTLPLWGDELGELLLEQHQNYLQQLLQQQPSLDTVPKRLRGRGVAPDSSFSQGAEFSESLPGGYAVGGGGGGRVLGSSDGFAGGVGRHGDSTSDVEQPYTLATYLRTMSLADASSPGGSESQQQQYQQQRSQSERWQRQQGADGFDTARQGGKGWGPRGGGLRGLTHWLLGVGVLPGGRHRDRDISSFSSNKAPSWQQQQQQQQAQYPSRTNSTNSHPGALAPTTYTTGAASTRRSTDSAAAAAAAAGMSGWQQTVVAPTVRLYQIVSPSLAGRAAVFGSHLALPESWHCIDPPYFDAPGVNTLHVGAAPPPAAAAAAMPLAAAVTSPHAGTAAEADLSAGVAAAAAAAGRADMEAGPSNLQQQQQQQQQDGDELLSAGGTDPAAAASPPPAPRTPAPAALRNASSWSPFAAAAAAAQTPPQAVSPALAEPAQQQQPQQQQLDLNVWMPRVLGGDSEGVTVVFTSVDGAHQLAAHPELARSLHCVLHRLMLRLLSSHFPGSYLIRAKEGELRYLAAFNSPTAAAAWCITLHEAALYAPYPHELLRFPGFGVQLDGRGRLVFRGPRLKAGFSEGLPNCISPDHMGRADYSGTFVNRAARFADAAAHGGRIVTEAELANRVLQSWQQKQQATTTDNQLPAAAPSQAASAVTAATAALSSVVVPSARVSLQPVHVEVQHLGSYLFKGSPRPVAMVSISPSPLAGRSYPDDAAPHGKGVRVAQQVGSMGGAQVLLPAAVEQEAYTWVDV